MSGNENRENNDAMATGQFYQQPRKSAHILPALALLVTLGFLGFVAYDSFMSDSGFKRIDALRDQLEATKAKLQSLEDESIQLQEAIEQMKTEPKAAEKVAREQLGFIKPGEKVFLLTNTPKPPEESATSDVSESDVHQSQSQ